MHYFMALFFCAFIGGMIGEHIWFQSTPDSIIVGVILGLLVGLLTRLGYLLITHQPIVRIIHDDHIDFSDGSWK